MDFRLYTRVLWRFKLIVVIGLALALSLAILSMIRIGAHGMTYRSSELWSSTTRLLVTQRGFPEGRLFAQEPGTGTQPPTSVEHSGIPLVDPNRLNALAVLYADLATSDPVKAVMRRDGAMRGQIIATPLKADESGTLLPLIDLMAISTSAEGAKRLSLRAADALETYLEEEQNANSVPRADRVVVEQVVRPKKATIYQPRSKTMAVVIFLAVMFATVALAFILENARPRARQLAERPEPELRRTA